MCERKADRPATPRSFRSAPCPSVRWDPTRENILFLNQSANLYANYYQLQIAVHRLFIPSPRKPSPLSFPSLAICTNAARSCVRVVDFVYDRLGAAGYQNAVRVPVPSFTGYCWLNGPSSYGYL